MLRARSEPGQSPSNPQRGPRHGSTAVRPDTRDGFAGLAQRHSGVFGGCWCTYVHTMHSETTFDADDNRSLKRRPEERRPGPRGCETRVSPPARHLASGSSAGSFCTRSLRSEASSRVCWPPSSLTVSIALCATSLPRSSASCPVSFAVSLISSEISPSCSSSTWVEGSRRPARNPSATPPTASPSGFRSAGAGRGAA